MRCLNHYISYDQRILIDNNWITLVKTKNLFIRWFAFPDIGIFQKNNCTLYVEDIIFFLKLTHLEFESILSWTPRIFQFFAVKFPFEIHVLPSWNSTLPDVHIRLYPPVRYFISLKFMRFLKKIMMLILFTRHFVNERF